MTPEEFVKLALKTESNNFSEIKQRLVNPETLEALKNAVKASIDASNELDRLKKHIFYGKDCRFAIEGKISKEKAEEIRSVFNSAGSESLLRLLHASCGLVTEGNELLEALESVIFKNRQIDYIHLEEELGDANWYIAQAIDSIGVSFQRIWTKVINKLKMRYGDRFTNEKAVSRNLIEERKVLEA